MRNMVYLASPYSHKDKKVEEARYLAVCKVTVKLIKQGLLVISPIAYNHMLVIGGDLPGDFSYWRDWDEHVIKACDELWVLMLDGWEKSKGIVGEMKIAQREGKTIRFLNAEGEEVPRA